MKTTRTRWIGRSAAVAAGMIAMLAGTMPTSTAERPPWAGTGGGPGGEEGTLGNNLSVPTVFVPSYNGAPVLRVPSAAGTLALPMGQASTEFPGYYLQKTESTWQAEYTTATTAAVVADWGDNLTERPTLTARQPLRVEMGLYVPTTMQGFVVEKLTPDVEDRYATYGTTGVPATFAEARVLDEGATLTVKNASTGVNVYDGPMSTEVNSTGAVVYGYNWGIKGRKNFPVSGTYELTFTTNHTTLAGVRDGAATWTPTSTTITVVLNSTSGGGGGHQ